MTEKIRYIVIIDDRMIGYSKKKKIATKFLRGYFNSNYEEKVMYTIVRVVKSEEPFVNDPDNEIIRVGRILLPQRYESAYFAYFYGSQIQQLILDAELILTSNSITRKERKLILDVLENLYEASVEEDLYVPPIESLDSATQSIEEYRHSVGLW